MLRLDLIFKKSKQGAAAAAAAEEENDRSELKKVFYERVHDRGGDRFLLQSTTRPTSPQEIVYI